LLKKLGEARIAAPVSLLMIARLNRIGIWY